MWFDWYRRVDDPNTYLLVEAFRDAAAGAAHVNTDRFKAAMARIPALLAASPEIVNVEVPGDGWFQMTEMHVEADS